MESQLATVSPSHLRRPRLGFLGVGWIGHHRLQAVADSGIAEIAAVADPDAEAMARAADGRPGVMPGDSLEALLDCDLDGLVIATPSAMHAEQAIAALERGLAVFCQKPLARTVQETRRVLKAARRADRLLNVDLCYRFVAGVDQMRQLVQSGALGDVYAVDLTFHNAYGPDKPWFYDRKLSGGGCVIDLGTHLVDLALWMFDFPGVTSVASRLYSRGQLLPPPAAAVEDFAVAQFDLDRGVTVRLGCSWRLHAGCDAAIEMSIYGTGGGLSLKNVNGSFYDFTVQRFQGTSRETLAAGPDAWGGRAIVAWAERLAQNPGYDPRADHLLETAEVLEAIYA